MTPDQAAGCLARLAAAFPYVTLNEHTATVWTEHLTTVHVADARQACLDLEARVDRFPSLNQFLDQCRTHARRRLETESARALAAPDETTSPAEARAQIDRLRAILARNPIKRP